jgi:hypothetical protein
VTTDADIVLFSTGYSKVVDLGCGGYAFVNERLGMHAAATDDTWSAYRQRVESSLSAALAQRAALNAVYASGLPAEIQLPAGYQHWRFNVRVRHRSAVMRAIKDAGLFAGTHYAALAPAPHAERLAGEVVNLFNDHRFDAGKAERICEILRKSGSSAESVGKIGFR